MLLCGCGTRILASNMPSEMTEHDNIAAVFFGGLYVVAG
jgi:hypothetical protein